MSSPNHHSEETLRSEAVDKAIQILGEYWDHVQILCTGEPPDGTRNSIYHMQGKGNWYARIGMAREFLLRDDESNRQNVRNQSQAD